MNSNASSAFTDMPYPHKCSFRIWFKPQRIAHEHYFHMMAHLNETALNDSDLQFYLNKKIYSASKIELSLTTHELTRSPLSSTKPTTIFFATSVDRLRWFFHLCILTVQWLGSFARGWDANWSIRLRAFVDLILFIDWFELFLSNVNLVEVLTSPSPANFPALIIFID